MGSGRQYHIAQFNWAILRDDWGTPAVSGFEDNLERLNLIAERTGGLIWRMPGEEIQAALTQMGSAIGNNARAAATLSVWHSEKSLENFVHNTVHGSLLRRRADWFVKQAGPTYVVWPVAVGHRPDLSEAMQRLEMLGVKGPTSEAFDFTWLRSRAEPAETCAC